MQTVLTKRKCLKDHEWDLNTQVQLCQDSVVCGKIAFRNKLPNGRG